jgi:ribonuclease G
VVDAGEPIPLLRRAAAAADPLSETASVESSYVLVPEASEEVPAEEPAPETVPLVAARPARDGKPGRRREPEAPPAPRTVPAGPAAPPDLVFVPEALLETVPEDWAEEDAAAEAPAVLLPAPPPSGRRKRRRGRDRGEAPSPVAPTAPPPAIVNVMRAEDEAPRERREREPKADQRESREYKEILINVGERETRIAVLENGRLVELHVEREERVVGGVYKARVSNVLPGMDAAFVDIGLERNAFLYVGDILFEDSSGRAGENGAPVRRTSRDVRIKDVARPGQEIMVQVVKGPRGTKGARVSTKMSIPGRYLVLMPEGDHLGVSRKVEDIRERERLKRIAEEIKPRGFGLIVRTEAEGRSEAELRQDLDYLTRTWNEILEKNKRAHAPALLHKDLGIILKTVRDLFGQDVDKLVVDSRDEYENAIQMLSQLAPDLVDRVHLYEDPEPILIRYNVEEEIDRLLRRKIWLRNGAYLLLDTTEALTTIDVNTGKFVGTSSLQETILKTNLDAVDEIARQLRLRDIGGMIVLDFIDMASARDRQLVMRKLEEAFKKDRTRIKIAHISPLGLVEMTRKRTAEAVTDVMSQACPYCQGRGRVWSAETMAIQIEREVLRLCAKQDVEAILIHANPEVAATLIGPEGEGVEQLERMIRRPVYIRANHEYHVEKYEIAPADMLEMERQMMKYRGGQIVDCRVTKIEMVTPPRSAAWADGYFLDLANGARFQGQTIRARLTDVRRSFAIGEPVAPSTSVDRSEPI